MMYCPHAYRNEQGIIICGTKTQRAGEEKTCHCVFFCEKCGNKWRIVNEEARQCRYREDYNGEH